MTDFEFVLVHRPSYPTALRTTFAVEPATSIAGFIETLLPRNWFVGPFNGLCFVADGAPRLGKDARNLFAKSTWHRYDIRDATLDEVARAELETFMATRKPDAVDIEVGQRIKIQRLTAGLSQTQLGEKIGVTFQQVQKYEKGANRLGIGRLTRVARALNVTVNSFFEGRDMIERIVRTGEALPFSLITHPHAFRLLQAYSTLKNEELRRSIVELVERLATKFGGQNARRK